MDRSAIARPWRSLLRGSLTARLIASLVALVIVTCAVVGVATYTVLRNSLMTNFSQSLQDATQRQYMACMGDGDSHGADGQSPHIGLHRRRALIALRNARPGPVGGHLRRVEQERDHHRGVDRQRELQPHRAG